MTIALDTLAFTKRLTEAGVDRTQAEAHAEAARDFIMPELATKADVQRLEHLIERQTLQLTVRLGGMVIAGVAALAAFRFFS